MRGFKTLHFEVSEDTGGIPGGGLTPGGLMEGEPPAPAEPEAPQVDSAQQLEELQAMVERQQAMLDQLAPVAEYMQAAPQPGGAQQGPQIPDPFSENYAAEMQAYLDARDQERLAPYQEVMQQQRTEALTNAAFDIIADIQAEHGEIIAPKYQDGQDGLAPNELILQQATRYYPEIEQRYGPGPRADEEAFLMAYNDVKALYEGWAAAHDARQQNQLSTLSNAPREPGASGIAAQQSAIAGNLDEFKARWDIS
jgi:hypothetical protein